MYVRADNSRASQLLLLLIHHFASARIYITPPLVINMYVCTRFVVSPATKLRPEPVDPLDSHHFSPPSSPYFPTSTLLHVRFEPESIQDEWSWCSTA